MIRVLVTGASGFVGRHLCARLVETGYHVRATLRSTGAPLQSAVETVVVGDIGPDTDWTPALSGVDCVIHAAARVHMMDDAGSGAARYTETNALGTQALAAAAAQAGVRRFIFLSSIKVNGEEAGEHAYTPLDTPRPCDAYGQSKWQAEQYLAAVCAAGGMAYSIVRPPLIYGPGVRANFLRLLRWVDREYPLPLAGIVNGRSLVNVWNLTHLLEHLITAAAANRTWMVSDGVDLSTPDLIRRLAAAMGRHARLFKMPQVVLRSGARLVGRSAEVARLCGSLRVDSRETRAALGWEPPVSVDEGLRRTVEWYEANR